MIVKPAHEETESRWLRVADQARAGREAIRTGTQATKRAGRKLLVWYLVIVFGFGFFASLLTLGLPGFMIGAAVLAGIWQWRRRAARA